MLPKTHTHTHTHTQQTQITHTTNTNHTHTNYTHTNSTMSSTCIDFSRMRESLIFNIVMYVMRTERNVAVWLI